MNESYAEAGAKRGKVASSYLIMTAMIFGVLFLIFVGSAFIGGIATFLATILVVACVYVFPRFNVEYEYVYCDGQIDFDKISGNAKRKTQLRIDFEKVDMVAPVNSHVLDSYNRNNNMVVKDFTSRKPDAKVYAIIYRGDKDITKILFEPSEKMLACIKQKTPRKISEV